MVKSWFSPLLLHAQKLKHLARDLAFHTNILYTISKIGMYGSLNAMSHLVLVITGWEGDLEKNARVYFWKFWNCLNKTRAISKFSKTMQMIYPKNCRKQTYYYFLIKPNHSVLKVISFNSRQLEISKFAIHGVAISFPFRKLHVFD